MKRYFICHKRKKVKPEFIGGTPVEILSPLYKHLQPLPTKKEELQILDFEVVEQLHLLQAEYNKRFQDAKHCIEKNDLARGVHYMGRSNDVKKRITELEKRHHDIMEALEKIVLSHPAIPQTKARIPDQKFARQPFEIPPTPK